MWLLKLFFVLVLYVQFSEQLCTNFDNVFKDIYCWSVETPKDINITSEFCKNQNLPPYYRVILRINDSYIPNLNQEYFKNFGGCQISNLNIHDSGIKDISPGTFDVFERLEVINFANNKIKVLKSGIFNKNQQFGNSVAHWKISSLTLDNNGLELIEDAALDNLENLQYLILKNNSLSTIPLITKWPKLFSLDLSNNYFETFNQKHSNLSWLILHKNKLTSFNFSTLQTPKLGKLDVSFNNISKLSAAGNSLGQISMLNISHNSITSLNITKNMMLLDWSYNNLGSVSRTIFRKASRLASLNLSGNNISFLSWDVFIDMTNLGILNLSDNKLHSLPGLIFTNTSLSSLDVSNNQLRSIDLNSIFNLRGLKYLWLHNNNIDNILVYHLPPNLKSISIFGNKFKSCDKLCDTVNQLKGRNVKIEFEDLLYKEKIDGEICNKCSNITNQYLAKVLKNLTIENREEYRIMNDKLNKIIDYEDKDLIKRVSLELKFVLGLLIFVILLVLIIHRKSVFPCVFPENEPLRERNRLEMLMDE